MKLLLKQIKTVQKLFLDIAIKFTHKFLQIKRYGVLPYGVNHFVLYPFWANEVACWSDLNSSQWASWNKK